MKILAIETSCDETAAAVVEDGTKIISSAVASSAAMHEKYGGIVPEVAAREQLRSMIPVINEALQPFLKPNQQFNPPSLKLRRASNRTMKQCIDKFIDAIAVTVGPGLIGSLLVGVETAKTIAFVTEKPIIPVNHVIAHTFANFVQNGHMAQWSHGSKKHPTIQPSNHPTISFPAISLVVSGGHTELYLMKSIKELRWLGGTLDDAAGEAFDKTARLLGFGSRGGVAIQETASQLKIPASPAGRENFKLKITLPRPMIRDESLNFSFSGLKTAVVREWKKYPHPTDAVINAFAYEIQEAITDVLVDKTVRAAKQFDAKSVLLSGGVAANQRLREKFASTIQPSNHPTISYPPVSFCTDNAVSIAACAFFLGKPMDWEKVAATPDLTVEGKFP